MTLTQNNEREVRFSRLHQKCEEKLNVSHHLKMSCRIEIKLTLKSVAQVFFFNIVCFLSCKMKCFKCLVVLSVSMLDLIISDKVP